MQAKTARKTIHTTKRSNSTIKCVNVRNGLEMHFQGMNYNTLIKRNHKSTPVTTHTKFDTQFSEKCVLRLYTQNYYSETFRINGCDFGKYANSVSDVFSFVWRICNERTLESVNLL